MSWNHVIASPLVKTKYHRHNLTNGWGSKALKFPTNSVLKYQMMGSGQDNKRCRVDNSPSAGAAAGAAAVSAFFALAMSLSLQKPRDAKC